MRPLIALALLLAGCTPGVSEEKTAALYRGEGRDRLCLVPDGDDYRAGVIAFGAGDANCSLKGKARRDADRLTITPRGDLACTIEATIRDGIATFSPLAASCAYYCGSGADLAGRSFRRIDQGDPTEVKDLAGDPLC